MPTAVQQRAQPSAKRRVAPRGRPARSAALQPGDVTVHDKLCPAREDRVACEIGLAVDREDPCAQHPLGARDGLTADATAFGYSRRKASQRAIGLGELQPAEA